MSGFRLGKIFGIEIDVDWSWLFIFFLVTWNLAIGVFPALHPDWGPLLSWGVGISASLLFFASVLAHELAHSLVARSRGLPVNKIILFLFGGVSNLEREPTSPGTEFFMAVVGPITSIVLGFFFLLLGLTTSGLGPAALTDPASTLSQLNPLSTLLLWLGPVNILVGLFNLIPGFPLDGGRVLRSILWAITNNFQRSTRWASRIGQGIGWLFIITGLSMVFGVEVPILGSGLLNGLWLALIGWFLQGAASYSYQEVVVRDILEKVPVTEVMRTDLPMINPDLPVSKLVYDHMLRSEERAFPVMEDSRFEGLVSLEDISRKPQGDWEKTPVKQIMTPRDQLDTVTPNKDLADAFNKITREDVGQLPVVQDSRLVGMVSRKDILLWLQIHNKSATDGLKA